MVQSEYMRSFCYRPLFCCFFAFCLLSCSATKNSTATQTNAAISSIRLLGEYDIPYALSFNNTTVGGLSGIDYDVKQDIYYFISDDRSAINPARFYTAHIYINQKGIDSIRFTGVKSLLQPNGNIYPNNKQDPANTPDPEAMRYDPVQNELIWSSEGERILRGKDTVLEDPSIRIITTAGKYVDSFPIPADLKMRSIEKGPRQNSVFEGISFADNYKTVFVNVEEPLYEDGPRADVTDNNAYIRILKFDRASRNNISQYAYKLDPIAYPANPAGAYKINGVPDILSIGNDKLLVIERSYSTGRLACTIKIFIANLEGASDIKNNPSLKENSNFKAADKKLLLNMDDLGVYIDNIEGVSFGPVLANGHKTLLFIADNNFSPLERSQVLLFEVIE